MQNRKRRRKLRGIALLLSKFDYAEVKREFDGITEHYDEQGGDPNDLALVIQTANRV